MAGTKIDRQAFPALLCVIRASHGPILTTCDTDATRTGAGTSDRSPSRIGRDARYPKASLIRREEIAKAHHLTKAGQAARPRGRRFAGRKSADRRVGLTQLPARAESRRVRCQIAGAHDHWAFLDIAKTMRRRWRESDEHEHHYGPITAFLRRAGPWGI